ncbi:zinc-binding dehydrogenase [Variovorax boronicumulans]|uniref:zinc-binding dehydrogenase n=1 Tax=Variovorax boronicumulans TaxID=436515 RepID=UPI001C58DBA4
MRAVLIAQDGQPLAQPQLREIDDPAVTGRQVLVQVRAAGMNRADLSLKTGHFRAVPSTVDPGVAGMEMAGEVLECGPDARSFKTGDRVMAMCAGAQAERVSLDERLLIPMPVGMSFVEAACLPAAMMTAHDALVTNGRFERGDNVLVQVASSAIGIAAIQMARLLGAREVIGTTSSPEKRVRLEALGLDHALLGGPDVGADVEGITSGHGADVVIDHLGAPALPDNMACAAIGARIVSVGRMGGLRGDIDMDLLSLKRLSLVGVTFRTRTIDDFALLIARMRADVEPLFSARTFTMPLDRVFALADVREAHERMRARQQFGKVVLEL